MVETTCKRCGARIFTGSRSLFGMDKLKTKYGEICTKCVTPEEKKEIDDAFRNMISL